MTETRSVVARRRERRSASNMGRVVTLTLAAVAFAVTAVQGSTGSRAEAASNGWARFGHFAPAVGEVDVLVDGKPFALGVAFADVSAYSQLPAGRHVVELRASGGRSEAPLLSTVAVVEAGRAVTVAVVSTRSGVQAQVYQDGIDASAPGRASVRFIHAIPEAGSVDVSTSDGTVLVEQLSYPRPSGYVDIAPGAYDLQVADAASGAPVLLVEGWSVDAGVQASVVVVTGLDGKLDVVPMQDLVSVSLAPAGGAETGFGGMAAVFADEAGADRISLLPLAALVLAPVLSAALLLRMSRRRPPAS